MATQPLHADLDALYETVLALVRSKTPDLTARQLGVFLTCYTAGGAPTVRRLAAQLRVDRPIISRALNRRAASNLIRRMPASADRRSVLIGRTLAGSRFLRKLKGAMVKAHAS